MHIVSNDKRMKHFIRDSQQFSRMLGFHDLIAMARATNP
jgi:hypothetical protein